MREVNFHEKNDAIKISDRRYHPTIYILQKIRRSYLMACYFFDNALLFISKINSQIRVGFP